MVYDLCERRGSYDDVLHLPYLGESEHMIARILPPEEWHKLSVTGMAPMQSTMRPEDVQMIVVEDGDRIVASMGTYRVTHFEGLWIDPEYRGNPGLGRRLIKAGIEAARKWTDRWVWGCSDTGRMDSIIERIGGNRIPVDSYIIPLGGN